MIQKKYRSIAAQLHPDKDRGTTARADEAFIVVGKAKDFLSDPEKRNAYNWKLCAPGSAMRPSLAPLHLAAPPPPQAIWPGALPPHVHMSSSAAPLHHCEVGGQPGSLDRGLEWVPERASPEAGRPREH